MSSTDIRPEVLISVCCMVFPDGNTYWMDDPDAEKATAVMDAWRATLPPERRKLFDDAGVMGGFVMVRMLRSDYQRIPATNAPWSRL